MKKFDLILWTLGKRPSLSYCVGRINQTIPENIVNQRYLIVAKGNINPSIKILAEEYNWNVIEQNGHGIGNAFQIGLELVETSFFMTFEDDVILCKNWFSQLFKYMKKPEVGCAAGIRISVNPTLKKFLTYIYADESTKSWFSSIDNNIFRTQIVREVGVPNKCMRCTDAILKKRIWNAGYQWIVDCTVISRHIGQANRSLLEALRHQRKMNSLCSRSNECSSHKGVAPLLRVLIQTFTSGIKATQLAIKLKSPHMLWYYPAHRVNRLLPFLQRWNVS